MTKIWLDIQITFWDAYDCQPIRVIDGSLSADMLSLDISPDGEGFVSGGGDREVKLWNYDEGHCYFVGLGHSSKISRVHILPHHLQCTCCLVTPRQKTLH